MSYFPVLCTAKNSLNLKHKKNMKTKATIKEEQIKKLSKGQMQTIIGAPKIINLGRPS